MEYVVDDMIIISIGVAIMPGGVFMAKIWEIWTKTKALGNKVTFSNKRSSRTWAPNIRRVKADVNGTVKRINVCTRCLRSGHVKRAI